VSIALRLIDEPAARAIFAGGCPPGYRCSQDYPAEGDRIAAGLFLQRLEAGLDPRPFGAFLVVLEPELVIGGIGFHGGIDDDGRVEIGYGITPSYRGRGHASQALALLIEIARELGASTLLAETDLDNGASRRVLERSGFGCVTADDHVARFEHLLAPG
jgi:RimJ/RimL family protein N-acetyltransferase